MNRDETFNALNAIESESYTVNKSFQTWMISDLSLCQHEESSLLELADQYKDHYQVFMLREKNLLEEERFSLIKELRAVLEDHRIMLNWNGRDSVDDWPIDGLHLGVAVWKKPETLKMHLHRLEAWDFSLAIHSRAEWHLAREMGYKPKACILSPVFLTTCKQQAKALGLVKASLLAREIREDHPECSIIAMGGIKPDLSMDSLKQSFDGAAIRSGWKMKKMITISK